MSTLSTHVLDTAHGRPATGVPLRLTSAGGEELFTGITNTDGRCPELPVVVPGRYQLSFTVADYFRGVGVEISDPPFLDIITIDFGISDAGGHYHVPLLVSPFSYSTYRGS